MWREGGRNTGAGERSREWGCVGCAGPAMVVGVVLRQVWVEEGSSQSGFVVVGLAVEGTTTSSDTASTTAGRASRTPRTVPLMHHRLTQGLHTHSQGSHSGSQALSSKASACWQQGCPAASHTDTRVAVRCTSPTPLEPLLCTPHPTALRLQHSRCCRVHRPAPAGAPRREPERPQRGAAPAGRVDRDVQGPLPLRRPALGVPP